MMHSKRSEHFSKRSVIDSERALHRSLIQPERALHARSSETEHSSRPLSSAPTSLQAYTPRNALSARLRSLIVGVVCKIGQLTRALGEALGACSETITERSQYV